MADENAPVVAPEGVSDYSESDVSDYSSADEGGAAAGDDGAGCASGGGASGGGAAVETVTPPTFPDVCKSGDVAAQVEGLVRGHYRLLDLVPRAWVDALGIDLVDALLSHVQRGLVESLKSGATVYPPPAHIFACLAMPPEDVRVVILGQNPYHGPGQAHGLAFSDNSGKVAPSLRNICEVIRRNGFKCNEDARTDGLPRGNLSRWVSQGVLLLNASLTVVRGDANSHMDLGWQAFTDEVIAHLARTKPLKAFCLWGSPAQAKKRLIVGGSLKHLVLTTSHPSPLSWTRGFRDCTHFREVNDFLGRHGRPAVDWSIV